MNQLTVGTKVRLIATVDLFYIDIFEPGVTGTVTFADETGNSDPVRYLVKLDRHFEVLDEWENCVQVGPEGSDESACWPSYWEPL